MKRNAGAMAGNSITEGSIWKSLLAFFFPIMLGTVLQQLYNTVDAMIVGQVVGKQGLAAVGGTTGALINLMVGFFVGLASGAAVIISQYWGAKEHQRVEEAVHTSMALALVGSVVLMVFGILSAPTLLKWMNTPDDVMGMAELYMRIYMCGMIPSMVYNIGAGILRAVGDSKRPLYFLLAACAVNVALDIVLVVWLKLGVAGAALATILSQLASAVLVVISLVRTKESYHLEFRKIGFQKHVLRQVIRIGLPAGAQSVMYSLSNAVIQASVNSFGTDILAAWTAFGKLDGIFWAMVNAFGVAITTFVGQNYGAGKIDRMRKGINACLLLTAGATVVFSAALYFFAAPLYQLFSNDSAVVEQGVYIMHLLAPTFITYIFIEVYSGALRGAGDAVMPTLMTLLGVCVLRVIWVMGITPMHNDVGFMLLSYPITWTVTSLAFLVYYHKGTWLKKRMAARADL
ncbi:MAG: MATE family efflux transporter [Clostridia bacterium]|nr:MATE family efflux transporter [Clostridia bacterium]